MISVANEPLKKHDPRIHGLKALLARYKITEDRFLESLEAVSGGNQKIIVTSKRALTEKEKDELKDKFESTEVEEIIDETVVGGVKIKKGDYVYDYSVKARLQTLSKHLKRHE